MTLHRSTAAIFLLIPLLGACGKRGAESASKAVGHHTTRLEVRVGSIWGDGYSVDVVPQEYAVIEHRSCPTAKAAGHPEIASGLCVLRITKEQSELFEAAMERFKRHAVPLQTISVEDWPSRPDGKPCRNQVTDSALISLTWHSTEGARIASFYDGCDAEEFGGFYKSVVAVTDALPIQQIIAKD